MNTKEISVQTTCIGYLERRTVGNFARSAQEVCVVKCRVIVTSIEKGSIVFVDWTVARGNLVKDTVLSGSQTEYRLLHSLNVFLYR